MDIYNILMNCVNCNAQNTLNIPKGTTIEQYKTKENPICTTCGCAIYIPPIVETPVETKV